MLIVLNPIIEVLETDSGNSSTIPICFVSSVQPLREVIFHFYEELGTTAEPTDYVPLNLIEIVILPGPFPQCVNITILGDDLVEDDEVIVLSVEAVSEGDIVQFDDLTTAVEVHIIDDDGKTRLYQIIDSYIYSIIIIIVM